MSGFNGQMSVEFISQIEIFQFHFIVGKVHVQFCKPLFIHGGFDGKPCPPYACSVVESENTVVLFQILVGFGGQSVYGFGRQVERQVRIDSVVQFQFEGLVPRLECEFALIERQITLSIGFLSVQIMAGKA